MLAVIINFRDAAGAAVDPNTWNFLEPKDLFNPRIFVCKAGRFVENVVKKVTQSERETKFTEKQSSQRDKVHRVTETQRDSETVRQRETEKQRERERVRR